MPRGGARPGAGRKPLPPEEATVAMPGWRADRITFERVQDLRARWGVDTVSEVVRRAIEVAHAACDPDTGRKP